MGGRVSSESAQHSRSSTPAMGCAWKPCCLGVALAVFFLLLGAAGTVEARPHKAGFEFAAGQSRFPVQQQQQQRKLQETVQLDGEPSPPAGEAVLPAEVGHSHGMKMAIVKLGEHSNARPSFRRWSPPGPGSTGTLEPGKEVVMTSLHVVPSGPNPLHN